MRIAFLIAMLMIVGFWLRIRHLGALGLIVDEGFQALAVQAILKDGVSKLDSGLIYLRAPLFLYAQTAAATLFELSPFWLRFPSVLFGTAAIFPAYLLGKTLFNRRVGLLTAAILAFSVWEIEMSRYARFYTAFQLMYLMSLFCFYRGFMLDERHYKFWFVLAALLTFSTHELSLMLFTLFLIPLPSASYSLRRKLSFGIWAVGLGGLFMLYHKLVLRVKAMGDPLAYLPTEGGEVVQGGLKRILATLVPPIYTPDLSFMFQLAHEHSLLFCGFVLIPGAATVYLIYRFLQGDKGWHDLLAIPMVWAAFMYQFSLVLVLLAVYIVFLTRHIRSLWDPTLKVVYSVVVICLVCWLPFFATYPDVTLQQKVVAMFGFPHFAKYFLYWLLRGWPLMTVIFLLGSILLLARFVSDRRDSASLFVLGAIFVPAVFTSFFKAFAEARYIFHFYPLIIMVVAALALTADWRFLHNFYAKGRWRQSLVVPVVVVGVFFISQDANPVDAWRISDRTYQNPKDPVRSVINWTFFAQYHQDHMSPSLYVRERLAPGDKVVVLQGFFFQLANYHFYTGGVDYVVGCPSHLQKFGRLKDGKIIHNITGSEILDNLPRVEKMIEEGTGSIWLLGDRKLVNFFCSKPMGEYFRSLVHNPDYVGLDGQTFAVKVR